MLHFDFVTFPVSDSISLVSEYLTEIVKSNNKDIVRSNTSTTSIYYYSRHTSFHARKIPSIDIHAYLSRILKYCPCTNDCLIAIVVYLERMLKQVNDKEGRSFVIDSYNIHRLIIVAFMISTKFFSDIFYTNVRYSKVGGLAVSELNSLELEFLKLNDFNLNIDSEELQHFADCLLNKRKPELDIPELILTESLPLESPLSSADSLSYQSWSPPSTPTGAKEFNPVVFNSSEFKNACYLGKSISSADLVPPIKHKFLGPNVDSIIRRPDTTHATSINHHSCSVPLHCHLNSSSIEKTMYTQAGEHRDHFKKLSIQSGRTYGSNLSDMMCSNPVCL